MIKMLAFVVVGACLLSIPRICVEADEDVTGLRLSMRDGRLSLAGAVFIGDRRPAIVQDGPIPGVVLLFRQELHKR